jgi:hypothetical protein
VYAYLKSLLTLEGEENTSLRAYATDTLGSIIKNMGRTYFEADLQEIMKCVGRGCWNKSEIHYLCIKKIASCKEPVEFRSYEVGGHLNSI